MKIKKVKKDEIANLRDELYMSMFWLGMGVVWLPGPELCQSLLVSAQEFVSVMFMIFIYTLDENIKIGGLVGIQMCTNQLKHEHEALILF
jgi:hypothetical protein